MTGDDKAILEFEKQRFLQAGAKAAAIRDELGLSEIRYYQRLNALLDDPEAEAVEPQLVRRLRRLRDRRRRGAA